MNFVNTGYLPYILIGSAFLFIVFFILNRKYFAWVKSYWFLERSWMSRFSSFFYGVSLLLMLASLLDLRGPEERVKSSLPDQKTIIILDSSASMLAEDVRPSRFGKAIQLARHFVKNAAGHQIAIVLFSDVQKRLIPFTDDIDLLDSRLAALEKTNSVSGGSNISQAIAEAVGYFEGDKSEASGNILVFTDAEESDDSFDVELNNNVNLAVVGIGTAKGGNIPLRWEDGTFRGYKTSKGEQVTTRLDEGYIKKLGKKVKSYKYWIANSYSLPTEDILNFFRVTYNKVHGKGDVRIRPVYSHFILIPAIIVYCLSVILGRFASFKTVASLALLVFLGAGSLHAQEAQPPKQKELPASLKKEMERMKSGKADRQEILKLAEGLLKNNEDEKARELYAEYAKTNDDHEVLFNRATSLLKTGKFDEALPLIQQLYRESKNEEMKNQMRHNVKLAMNNQSGGKSQNKDNNKDQKEKQDEKNGEQDKKDNKDQGDKGKDQQDKKDQQGKDGKDDKKDKSGKDGKDSKGQQKDKGDGKDQNEDKKEGDKGDDPKDLDKPPRPDQGPKNLQEKEKMIETKRKMIKTPAMVKQIMNDDRELQKKMMDTSTNERGSLKQKRDW